MTAAEVNGTNKVGVQSDRSDGQYVNCEATDTDSASGGLEVVSSTEPDASVGVAGFQICCAPEPSGGKAVLKLLACVFAGVVFGWCMEKSRGRCMGAGGEMGGDVWGGTLGGL